MNQFEVLKSIEHSEPYLELSKRIRQSLKFEVSSDKQVALLDKIREGNSETIPELIKASESMIYKIIQMIPDSKFTIDERFSFAKKALESLATKEVNSTERECFLRFGAFHVKQALLKLESQQSKSLNYVNKK